MSCPVQRLLIVKTSSIGDVVHALPVAQIVKEHLPGVRIGWVVKNRCAELLDGNPYLDHIYRIADSPTFSDLRRLRRELRAGGRYDAAWDMQGLSLSGLITRMSGASRRIGLDLNREGNRWFLNEPVVPVKSDRRRHAIDILRGFLPTLGIPSEIEWPRLCYLAEGVDLPAAFQPVGGRRDTVALNVGASSVYKQWPADNWSQLIVRLTDAGLNCALTGGPHDAALAQLISEASGADRSGNIMNLAGQTSLRQTAAVLNRCAALVTGDTGPMHIAAALSVPIIALFGPTDPVKTGPYHTPGVTLKHNNCCTANHRRPTCNGAVWCMSAITVDEAYDALMATLKDKPVSRC